MKSLAQILSRTEQNGECLEWTGCLNTDGYPRMAWKGSANGKVHRIVYELHNEDEPQGYVVRHTCDNPLCINPHHLVKGTPTQNMQDRQERGRTHKQVRQHQVIAVRALREEGLTYKQIADALNIKWKRVEYILTRMKSH